MTLYFECKQFLQYLANWSKGLMLETIDLRGTRCPLTLLKMKQILLKRSKSGVVHFQFDDPGAAHDLPVFMQAQNWCCDVTQNGSEFIAVCRLKELKA